MKTIKYWIRHLAVDAAIAALFVLWKARGIEGAGNVVLTYFWFVTCITIFVLTVADKLDSTKITKVGKFAISYFVLSTIAEAVVLTWYGHYVLGCLYVLAGLLWIGKRDKIASSAAAQQAAA